MTVLSRGARVRRGGRRPGWVLLTTLLVLAIGASSALVFTDRVELLKLAVILALWAAVAGAFVSVLYRRQAEADQARARDMKLVYDLQLDREISARREYELTVESQLRRELAAELRAQAADEIAALRAELSALRTNLEILFDTDLEQRPALETLGGDAARALTDRGRNGAQNGEVPPADWVPSDRVTAVRRDEDPLTRTDEVAIIDVPEEPLVPPRQPAPVQEYAPPMQPEPRHRPAPPPPQPPSQHQGRRRRYRDAEADDTGESETLSDFAAQYGGGRRSRSRHSAEYREHGVSSLARDSEAVPDEPPLPPRLAPPPAPAPRHRSAEELQQQADENEPPSGGQTVADLLARLQVQPSGGGRRRRRDE